MAIGQAWAAGLRVFVRAIPAFVLIYGALVATDYLLDDFLPRRFLLWSHDAANAASLISVSRPAAILAAMLLAYTVLNATKAARVTFSSWIPSLLLVPVGLVAACTAMAGGKEADTAVFMFSTLATYTVWLCFCESLGVTALYAVAETARGGETSPAKQLSAAWASISERGVKMIAVHGGLVTVSFVGFQVIIPGFILSTRWVFADLVAIHEPDAPIDPRAARLAGGSNARRAMLLWYLPTAFALVVSILVGAAFDEGGVDGFITTQAMAAFQIPEWQTSMQAALVVLATMIGRFATVEMFHHRVGELAELDKAPSAS
jgi:hypothetical protein